MPEIHVYLFYQIERTERILLDHVSVLNNDVSVAVLVQEIYNFVAGRALDAVRNRKLLAFERIHVVVAVRVLRRVQRVSLCSAILCKCDNFLCIGLLRIPVRKGSAFDEIVLNVYEHNSFHYIFL